ncbi:MAG: LysR family transcriptional regulator [Oscillospiraceae bacterium]|nr:LysR family transcriptional regulator [Oscillospiraceae bacterium]
MTIQQLRYAVTISEVGSLNKASEILYVAQPSLTSAIRELEKELDVTLFSRSGRGVTLTNEGTEFIRHARQVLQQYDGLLERFGKSGARKKHFGVSTQHYSFAVKSFVELVKRFGMDEYEFAIRETRTRDVIDDVFSGKSEIGILYLSDFNRKPLEKLMRSNQLEFHPLTQCEAYVYLWKGHPLARKPSIRFEDLADYPCLAFEQGASGSFYYAEEILSTAEYPRMIRATDRATMLNLMVGLNGYTLCSGVICEELNGADYVAVPFSPEDDAVGSRMEIGYVVRKNVILSTLAELYITELDRYLKQYQEEHS